MFSIVKGAVIAIIGAGVYGTAIAIALAKGGNTVILWGHDPKKIRKLKSDRSNQIKLPNIFFPPSLCVEESLSVVLRLCQVFLIAVPSHVFRVVLNQLKLNLRNDIGIIIASKGLEPQTGRLLQEVVYDILGNDIFCAVISGPTFARELALGMPTAITLASNSIEFSYYVQNLLYSIKNLLVYEHTDMIGIQIAGAVKNVIAIGVGISDGIGFGANARIALITRGLAEISRFGVAIGATASIFTGLAGLGDLVLTCTDNQSRNRRFGILLGQGVNMNCAKKKIGQIVEGIHTAKEVYRLSVQYGISMPITKQVYEVLYKSKSINEAVFSLMKKRKDINK